jgi:hypothetical protein
MLLFETEWFITIRFAVSILAAIMVVFTVQGRELARPKWLTWVMAPLLVAVVVLYNPINDLTVGLSGQAWALTEVAAAAVVCAIGLLIRTPLPAK